MDLYEHLACFSGDIPDEEGSDPPPVGSPGVRIQGVAAVVFWSYRRISSPSSVRVFA